MSKSKPRTEYRCRGAIMPTASHPAIRKVKRQGNYPSIHGNKLWKSSLLLIDYLNKNPPEAATTVLDAGCGWGLAGIWCARKLGSEVISVDADDEVFPFLQAVAELNKVSTTTRQARFQELRRKDLRNIDLLIAADICFWDELVDPVFKLIDRAVKAGVKQIVIADPERSSFLEMAERSMQKHYGDLLEWEISKPVKARGALLVIHNA